MPFIAPFLMAIVQAIMPSVKQKFAKWKKERKRVQEQGKLLKLKKLN